MNVKGGIAYIDLKGANIAGNTIRADGLTKAVIKAYNSKKLIVIHNAMVEDEKIDDIIVFSIRKRAVGNMYVLTTAYTKLDDARLTLRYITIGTNDTASVYSAIIG